MPEEVLLKSEQPLSREEIAAYLEQVAEKLRSGESIALESGDQSVMLDPPERPTFEVKVEREGSTEMSIELEIEWDEGATGDGGLSID